MTHSQRLAIATRSIFAVPDMYAKKVKSKHRNTYQKKVFEIDGVPGQFTGVEELHTWLWERGCRLALNAVGTWVFKGKPVHGYAIRCVGMYDMQTKKMVAA